MSIVQAGSTILWDLIVGGWDVTYLSEFAPSAQESYATLIEKNRKLSSSNDLICNSFKESKVGKVVPIIENSLSRNKKVATYRYMVKKNIV